MTFIRGREAWNKKTIDQDRLVREYTESSAAIKRLALEWNVSVWTLYNRLKDLGIGRRTQSAAHKGLQGGSKNPYWKGGRHVNRKTGYAMVRKNCQPAREHRIVMERILGRELLPSEHVHHKNGNKADNRPENLQIMSPSEHAQEHARLRRERKSALL